MKKGLIIIAVAILTISFTKNENKTINNKEVITNFSKDSLDSKANKRIKNMQEAHDYIKECGYYMLATTEDEQPRVRVFSSFEIINGKIYIMTGKKKDVYKQLAKNGKFELVAMKPDRSEWLRISGILVDDPDTKVQEEYLRRNPQFNSFYQAGDGNMTMLFLTNVNARYGSSFGGSERDISF